MFFPVPPPQNLPPDAQQGAFGCIVMGILLGIALAIGSCTGLW
jgi:hypothetical protein